MCWMLTSAMNKNKVRQGVPDQSYWNSLLAFPDKTVSSLRSGTMNMSILHPQPLARWACDGGRVNDECSFDGQELKSA